MEGRPLEDTELVDKAKHDARAYEELVLRYQDLAVRTAYHVTANAADAEDAAQEAFVKAYYALGRFRSGSPFRPWILRIVANEARKRRKAAGRRANLAVRAADAQALGDTALSPEAAAEAAERRRLLQDALQDLREDDRLILTYRYFLDLSEADMAELLGCARGTVKSRLSRAMDRLRERLGRSSALAIGLAPGGPNG